MCIIVLFDLLYGRCIIVIQKKKCLVSESEKATSSIISSLKSILLNWNSQNNGFIRYVSVRCSTTHIRAHVQQHVYGMIIFSVITTRILFTIFISFTSCFRFSELKQI